MKTKLAGHSIRQQANASARALSESFSRTSSTPTRRYTHIDEAAGETTMEKTIVLDELHVTFRIPNDLPSARSEELGLILKGTMFMKRLRRAIRMVVRSHSELDVVCVFLSR